jgi:hypothetical protein
LTTIYCFLICLPDEARAYVLGRTWNIEMLCMMNPKIALIYEFLVADLQIYSDVHASVAVARVRQPMSRTAYKAVLKQKQTALQRAFPTISLGSPLLSMTDLNLHFSALTRAALIALVSATTQIAGFSSPEAYTTHSTSAF